MKKLMLAVALLLGSFACSVAHATFLPGTKSISANGSISVPVQIECWGGGSFYIGATIKLYRETGSGLELVANASSQAEWDLYRLRDAYSDSYAYDTNITVTTGTESGGTTFYASTDFSNLPEGNYRVDVDYSQNNYLSPEVSFDWVWIPGATYYQTIDFYDTTWSDPGYYCGSASCQATWY